MPIIHIVKQGECLSSIAHAYGFKSYRAIYEHPDNQAFRKMRPDPAVLQPGDEIVIPEKKLKMVSINTGKTHAFQVTLPRVKVRRSFPL